MRRIDRMRDEASRTSREPLAPLRCRDRRCGAGENRIGRREAVEVGEQRLLCRQIFGDILLHIAGAADRFGKRGRRGNACARHCRLFSEETCRSEVGERAFEQREALVQRAGVGVVYRDCVPGSCEHDRPGAPDQPGADDCDLRLVRIHQTSDSTLPHTDNACPEILLPASVARKSAMFAMSTGLTVRRSDTLDSNWRLKSSKLTPSAFALAEITRSMRSPSTTPGWIALTRMFAGPSSIARLLVN